MQKLYFLLALICLGHSSHSQMRLGILGGPHSASVNQETSNNSVLSSRSGLNLGVIAELPLSAKPGTRWFFHPGVMYMAKGRKFYFRNDSATSVITDTISLSDNLSVNYMEIPLNIVYKAPLSKKVRFILSAGPYVGLFYNGKQKLETRVYTTNGFKDEEKNLESGKGEGKINTLDAGLNARAGFEIGNAIITGFMSRGLSNFNGGTGKGDFNHKVTGLSVGFWLNKVKQQPKKATEVAIVIDTVKKIIPQETPVKDTDGDGITDNADSCPTEHGTPDFNGCPIPDSDGDGSNDLNDECPQEAGRIEHNGCPEPANDALKEEVVEKVKFAARDIFFNASSDKLAGGSEISLNEIVELLQSNPSYKMTIEGHTDSTGKAETNKILSQKRAESVKKYLIEKGIDGSRLTAIGLGSENPLESNKTPAGRTRNRRVELKLAQ